MNQKIREIQELFKENVSLPGAVTVGTRAVANTDRPYYWLGCVIAVLCLELMWDIWAKKLCAACQSTSRAVHAITGHRKKSHNTLSQLTHS